MDIPSYEEVYMIAYLVNHGWEMDESGHWSLGEIAWKMNFRDAYQYQKYGDKE